MAKAAVASRMIKNLERRQYDTFHGEATNFLKKIKMVR